MAVTRFHRDVTCLSLSLVARAFPHIYSLLLSVRCTEEASSTLLLRFVGNNAEKKKRNDARDNFLRERSINGRKENSASARAFNNQNEKCSLRELLELYLYNLTNRQKIKKGKQCHEESFCLLFPFHLLFVIFDLLLLRKLLVQT